MHIKFTNAGKGNAKETANYLMDDKDHKGLDRPGIEVLEGNPHDVAALANTLPFKSRYTHGIISFAKEDSPTKEDISNVISDFKNAAFGDLDESRYSWSVVMHHEEDGGKHLHIITAKVDLETGKQLNIAEPGWQKHYDLLRDAWNHEKGWARPDDPARSRLHSKGFEHAVEAGEARLEAHNLKEQLGPKPSREGAKTLLNRYAVNLIENGAETRTDLVRGFQEAGMNIPRQGKDYITVELPETGSKYRLKGNMYHENFNSKEFKHEQERTREQSITGQNNNSREEGKRIGAEKRRELERSIERRNERFAKRFAQVRAQSKKMDFERTEGNRGIDSGPEQASTEHIEKTSESGRQHKERDNRVSEINGGNGSQLSEQSEKTNETPVPGSFLRNDRELGHSRNNDLPSNSKPTFIDNLKAKIGEYHDKAKQRYDSFRDSVNERIGKINRGLQEGNKTLNGFFRKHSESSSAVERNTRSAISALERAGESHKSTIENNTRAVANHQGVGSKGHRERLQEYRRDLPGYQADGSKDRKVINGLDNATRKRIELKQSLEQSYKRRDQQLDQGIGY